VVLSGRLCRFVLDVYQVNMPITVYVKHALSILLVLLLVLPHVSLAMLVIQPINSLESVFVLLVQLLPIP
jgi:hypothetical protein